MFFSQSGLGVEGELLVGPEILPSPARLRREPLGGLEAAPEPPARGPQRELGIDLQLSGDVDGGEEDVAHLVERRLAIAAGDLAELLELGLDGVVGHLREVEAGGRGAALHLPGVERSGEVLGDLAEDPRRTAGLPLLDPVPVREHLSRIGRLGLPEHVRVAPDELLAAVLGNVGQRAGAALLEQEGEEVDLEEDVAELVEELRVVIAVRRVSEFVRLLDGVRDDRALVLLAVPRALAAQSPRQVVERFERGGALSHPAAAAAAAAATAAAPAAPAPAATAAAGRGPWASSWEPCTPCTPGPCSPCGSRCAP